MKETVLSLLDEWRVWILIVVLALSMFSLFSNPFASGAVITDIAEDSPFAGRAERGDRITGINGRPIKSPADLMEFEDHEGTLTVQTDKELVIVQTDGEGLGITTEEVRAINLDFGMDIVGGTRVLLEPQFEEGLNETEKTRLIEETITTLETRLNVFGLDEMEFERMSGPAGDFIQIEAAGVGRREVEELLERTGEFEAYIPRTMEFGNRTTYDLVIGGETHTFERTDGNMTYRNRTVGINDTFEIQDMKFEVWNITDGSATVAGRVFSSDDIRHVYKTGRDAYVRQNRQTGLYEFNFKILISSRGAERFALLTEGLEGQDPSMVLFMDREEVTALSIQEGLIGQEVQEPVITGSRQVREDALREMNRLQSVLDSGRLPVELKQVQIDSISPRLGEEMLRSSIVAGIGALMAVTLIIFILYRKKEIITPVIFTSFSEVVIILGFASIINWTIDLPAIAGIIAAIGSSVDDQIVITSETLREMDEDKSRYSLKRRIKRAFFIVFTAAATTIMAMVVLGFVGIGMMRGFAITTIIGVLAGVLITRPVFGKILERVL